MPIPASMEMSEEAQKEYKRLKLEIQGKLVPNEWRGYALENIDYNFISRIARETSENEHYALFNHPAPETDKALANLLSHCPRKDYAEWCRMFNDLMGQLPTHLKGEAIDPNDLEYLPRRDIGRTP